MFADREENSLKKTREKLPWPKDTPFKILSLDGGGIRGIFTSTVLKECEATFCRGGSISEYFDLVAGTSTGGILAIAIGLQKPADHMQELYLERGEVIFPPPKSRLHTSLREAKQFFMRKYSHDRLQVLLHREFEDKLLGESVTRLCVPAALVPKSEIAVLKTDHHPDYKNDWKVPAWMVARATAAAPTYFEGHETEGSDKVFIDGGVWANNPIMVAIVEAMSAYQIALSQIRVLSISPGSAPYEINRSDIKKGLIKWRKAITACMHLSSQNSTSMAQLLLGHERVIRIEPGEELAKIGLDDWTRAKDELPGEADTQFDRNHEELQKFFEKKCADREFFYTKH